MKLQKLTIKNLASIEEAVIDFENGPIARESIFLICGETGSGKSTILDAICLALYNDTPRMQRSPNEKYMDQNQSFFSKKEEVAITDVRQLMRRNTVEAFVELDFTGSNEIPYTARWSVAKAHKKVDGNLKNVEWKLLNHKTGQELTKRNDIIAEIQECIGLNFEQFCRTTMLAQGEFTRFLQSKGSEKSEILEKLTGTNVYSEIGSKIYTITQAKEKAFRQQQQKIKDTRLLSDGEKEEMRTNMQTCQQEILNMESLQKAINLKYNWIEKNMDYLNTQRELQEEWCRTENAIKSDEFLKNQDTIRKWDLTVDARSFLKACQKGKLDEENQKKKEKELQQKYRELSAGILYQNQLIQKMNEEKAVLLQFLESQKAFTGMFEQSQTIVNNLKGMISAQTRKDKLVYHLNRQERNIPEAEASYKTKASQLKEEEDKGKELQSAIDSKNKEIQNKNIGALQQKVRDLSDTSKLLGEAYHSLELLSSYKKTLDETRKAEKETLDKLEAARTLQTSLQAELDKSRKDFDEIEAAYEKQKEGTEKWAEEARSRLRVGDNCPVCGQTITELPSLQHFQSILEPIQDLMLSRKKILEEAKTKVANNIAYGKSTKEQYQRNESQRISAEKNYNSILSESQKKCTSAGFLSVDENTAQLLEEKLKTTKTEQDQYHVLLEQAQLLLKERDALQVRKDRQQQLIDLRKEELNKQGKALDELKNQILTQKELIDSETKNINRSLDEVRKQVLWTDWENEWNDSPLNFINRIQRETDVYTEKQKRLENITNRLIREQDTLNEVLALQKQTSETFPSWTAEVNSALQVFELKQEWANLYAESKVLNQSMVQTSHDMEDASGALEKFYSEHPEISREELPALAVLNKEQIEAMKTQLLNLQNQLTTLKGKLELANQNIRQHEALKPSLEETDNLESLKVENTVLTEKVRNFNQQIGQIQMRLSENTKQEVALKHEKQKETELEAEFQKWDRLCSLFGDARGSHFRNIAQSFVLKELLHGANYYLNRLSDRYELECQAGSLTILLRDYYQGGTARPASTLSGGESFLVSLSLALGLSSISRQSLSVDTLFIDEGFGTLSDGYLQVVMDTLEKLHQMGGKKVGIISHVEGLRERIKAQIQVKRLDNSRSEIISVITE